MVFNAHINEDKKKKVVIKNPAVEYLSNYWQTLKK